MEPLDFRRRQFLRVVASLGLAVDLGARVALAAGEPIAVVVSSNSRQRGLSSDKLRRIFLALPTDDDDGHRFVPINLSQSSGVRERFDRGVLNMSPEDAARYWIDQRLRGNKPPRSAGSLDICRRAVQELPGAISYLPLSAVGSLHVLSVDGRAPSETNYALR
jgi:ABC-type phosphate transport system substrate-binding protein